jgi:hypothetical protein
MKGKLIAEGGSGAGWWLVAILTAALPGIGGCESPFQRIDRRTSDLLTEANADLGPETRDPRPGWPDGEKPPKQASENLTEERPATVNPTADQMVFSPARDGNQVMQRLEDYAQVRADALELDLNEALAYAIQHGREYRFAEEDFLLSALRLLSERHLWGPRVFNDPRDPAAALRRPGLRPASGRSHGGPAPACRR